MRVFCRDPKIEGMVELRCRGYILLLPINLASTEVRICLSDEGMGAKGGEGYTMKPNQKFRPRFPKIRFLDNPHRLKSLFHNRLIHILPDIPILRIIENLVHCPITPHQKQNLHLCVIEDSMKKSDIGR